MKWIDTHEVSCMLSSCPEPCVPFQTDEAVPISSEQALDDVNWPFLRCILKQPHMIIFKALEGKVENHFGGNKNYIKSWDKKTI